jgi:hypothetical protein
MTYNSREQIPENILEFKVMSFQKACKQFPSRKTTLEKPITLKEFFKLNTLFTYEINYVGNRLILYLEHGISVYIMHPEAFHAQFNKE